MPGHSCVPALVPIRDIIFSHLGPGAKDPRFTHRAIAWVREAGRTGDREREKDGGEGQDDTTLTRLLHLSRPIVSAASVFSLQCLLVPSKGRV